MRKNKIFFFLIAFVLFISVSYTIFAQTNQHFQEIIYLKNGTIIKGIILEHLADKSIRVKTTDQSEVIYKAEEVDHIVKEFYDIRQKGYFNLTEMSFAVGKTDASMGISTVNGYIIKPHFSLGLGVAYDYYVTAGSLLPVFADVRITFHDKRFTPFIYGDGGYSFGITSNNNDQLKGGVFLNPGIGIKSYISKRSALIISAGARVQGLQYQFTDPVNSSVTDRTNTYYTMLVVKVGIRF
jgi:hypothetical protein